MNTGNSAGQGNIMARTLKHERAQDVGGVWGWPEGTYSWHSGFQGNTKK